MTRCELSKNGKHCLMAIIPDDTDKPLTMVCSWCGAFAQYPLTWSVGESLDNLSSAEILERVKSA